MVKEMLEIRWHGRGGQGVVTASKLLAEAALEEGKYFQGMPDYGAERMGAPIRAYNRISSQPIKPYCMVTEPDTVVVLDPFLLGAVDVTEGLKEEGVVLVNTPLRPEKLRPQIHHRGKIATVGATAIAMETLGRNLPNVPMLGALVRITGIASKEVVAGVIRGRLGATLKAEVVEANLKAFEKAYAEVQEE